MPTSTKQFVLNYLMDKIGLWRRRICDRRRLARLDAHVLKDMGLTCAIAAREARRPFWSAMRLGSD